MSCRHAKQRSNRVRLKADCNALLQAIQANGAVPYQDEIAEMRVRLHPPSGAAAPIVLTGYTKHHKKRGPVPEVAIDWKAEAVLGSQGFDSIRYRKD